MRRTPRREIRQWHLLIRAQDVHLIEACAWLLVTSEGVGWHSDLVCILLQQGYVDLVFVFSLSLKFSLNLYPPVDP